MIVKGKAIYFDGNTSKAQAVEVVYNSTDQTILFEIEQETLQWSTSQCTIQVIKGKLEVHLDTSTEYFESHDIALAQALERTAPTIKSKNIFHRLMHAGFKVHLAILAFIVGFSAFIILVVLPFVAEKSVGMIPESFDDQLGQTVYHDMLLGQTVDHKQSELVQSFANHLNLKNRKKIHLTVVESSTVNAFALPNGEVVIYTGILQKMKDYPELAALIGHEVSHVNQRHSMKALCRNLSTYFFISVLLGDVNGVLTIIGQNAAELENLSYSRNLEEEADQMGFEILKTNRVNPQGFVDLFTKLNSNSSYELPEFLSTHPVNKTRIATMKKHAKGVKFVENDQLKRLFLQIKAQGK